MRNNLFIIAQSGWSYVLTSFVLFVLFVIVDCEFFAFLAFVSVLVSLFVFRNPERELLNFEEEAILSPVDGVVTAIKELDGSEYAYRVDVKSSYRDVSLLRVPMNSTVENITLEKGTRLSYRSGHAETLNENVEIIFVDKKYNKIKVKHTLTRSFAPLSIDIIKSQTLLKSSRYGVMLCGITSIYLPANVRVNINIQNELKASQTLIGFLS